MRNAGDPMKEADETFAFHLRAADRVHAAHAGAVATSFAPLVAMGTEILKAVALINGGAGAATLLVAAGAMRDDRALALALVLPLSCFGFGLTVAACATGFSYFAQEQHGLALTLQERGWSPPYIADTPASGAARARGDRYRRLALGAVFVGIGSAVSGFTLAGVILIVMLR